MMVVKGGMPGLRGKEAGSLTVSPGCRELLRESKACQGVITALGPLDQMAEKGDFVFLFCRGKGHLRLLP
jgi:hypothetical protein